jgi:hypothetical protein
MTGSDAFLQKRQPATGICKPSMTTGGDLFHADQGVRHSEVEATMSPLIPSSVARAHCLWQLVNGFACRFESLVF